MILNLTERYASAFGTLLAGKLINSVFVSENSAKDYNITPFPIIDTDFEQVTFEIENSNVEKLTFSNVLTVKDTSVSPPLLLSFSQDKALIETKVNDSNAYIVERWATNPYKIDIKGLLIDLENRHYPTEKIRQLNQQWQQNAVVKVVGQQFEELDIHSVYFNAISFKKLEGFQDTVQFSISATAIQSLDFFIN